MKCGRYIYEVKTRKCYMVSQLFIYIYGFVDGPKRTRYNNA